MSLGTWQELVLNMDPVCDTFYFRLLQFVLLCMKQFQNVTRVQTNIPHNRSLTHRWFDSKRSGDCEVKKKQAKCLFHTPARQPRTHSHHSADPSHTDALKCRIRVSHRLQTPPWRRWDRWKCLKWILFETSNCPALLKHVLLSDTLSHLRVWHFFL